MTQQHRASAILPCNDIEATQAFYERLGFTVTGGDAGFRILTDGAGWQIALRPAEPGWVIPDRNSHGIYLHCDDVDAVADRVRDTSSKRAPRTAKPGACTNSRSAIPTAYWSGSGALYARAIRPTNEGVGELVA